MKKTIFIIFLLFTFVGISIYIANSAIDGAVRMLEQQDRQNERGRQQLKKFSEDLKDWGQSVKIKRIEKALLKFDTWDRANLMKIMDEYNASLDEMNKAMSNVSFFNGYVR